MGRGQGSELTTYSACVHYTEMGRGQGAELTTYSACVHYTEMGRGQGAELTTHSACVHYTQMGRGQGPELTTHSANSIRTLTTPHSVSRNLNYTDTCMCGLIGLWLFLLPIPIYKFM